MSDTDATVVSGAAVASFGQQQDQRQQSYSQMMLPQAYAYYQQQQQYEQQPQHQQPQHQQPQNPPLYNPTQSQGQHQFYQHYQQQYEQQQQQQQHSYAYSHMSPVSSPTLHPGYLSASPPAQLAIPAAQTASPSNNSGGYAIVGGQILSGAQGYAYYAASMGASPGGSPQMVPLSVSPGAAAHYMAPMPISQLQSTSPATRDIEHFMVCQMAQGIQQRTGTSPMVLGMSPPYISALYQRPADQSAQDTTDSRNVYIRNLPEDCTDDALVLLASPYGEIESSKSIINDVDGKCKGYGFVKYKTAEQAMMAIAAFKIQGLPSNLAKDSFKSKLKRLHDKKSANVYISNLPTNFDDNALIEIIKPFPVISVKILKDALTGQPKGAGFARMPDRETAIQVIEKLKQTRLPNNSGPLTPRIADSDEQKQLKKQVHGEGLGLGGGRYDDSGMFVRSEATSPVMWSPVLVYAAASPPPAFDHLGSAAHGEIQMTSSPPQQHHMQQEPYMGGNNIAQGYPIPGPNIYAAHPGYVSPGYMSPGYLSPVAGYASPVQMPASPQMIYAHLPEQARMPVGNVQQDVSADHAKTHALAQAQVQ
ncbi:hypothetical protein LPJ66_008051, partial [Kickxella alabastrina]